MVSQLSLGAPAMARSSRPVTASFVSAVVTRSEQSSRHINQHASRLSAQGKGNRPSSQGGKRIFSRISGIFILVAAPPASHPTDYGLIPG